MILYAEFLTRIEAPKGPPRRNNLCRVFVGLVAGCRSIVICARTTRVVRKTYISDSEPVEPVEAIPADPFEAFLMEQEKNKKSSDK